MSTGLSLPFGLPDRGAIGSGLPWPHTRERSANALRNMAYRIAVNRGSINSPPQVSTLALGSQDEDFPFPCSPGVYGNDNEIETQLSHVCAGACPAGSICPSATQTPQRTPPQRPNPRPLFPQTLLYSSVTTPTRGAACTAGSYCPQGSAAGTFCPPGTVSNSTSLISAEECDTCPVGHFCVSGIASSCAVSTYNPLVGQFLRTACMSCPENAVTIRTTAASAADCVCIVGHYNHRPTNATAECTPCPVGANCTDQGTTLASLQLFTGYYRTSTASIDLRRCPDFGDGSGCVGGMSDGEGPCKPKLEARLHSTRHMHAHATS